MKKTKTSKICDFFYKCLAFALPNDIFPFPRIELIAQSLFSKKYKEEFDGKLARCKNVHFMYNDKFANPTIDFINRHFPKEDNLFLLRRLVPDGYFAQKFPEGDNVFESDCRLLNAKKFGGKKLIFYSLFDQTAVRMLYKNPELLDTSYWDIWGGDLYNAPKNKANTFVRKNIYGIITTCDAELAKEKYGSKHAVFDAVVTVFPTHYEICKLSKLKKRQSEKDLTVVQINNSADASTLEMLDILAKFKDENIRIKTVLSYGNRRKFKKKIIDRGNALFGDKFSYLDKMLSPAEYAEYLSENDALILYQNRQQGFGNIYNSLILGSKVFVKSDVLTTQYFQKNGVEIFDSNKIKDMNFSEFCEISEEILVENAKKVADLLSEERLVDEFCKVFNDSCGGRKT